MEDDRQDKLLISWQLTNDRGHKVKKNRKKIGHREKSMSGEK